MKIKLLEPFQKWRLEKVENDCYKRLEYYMFRYNNYNNYNYLAKGNKFLEIYSHEES